MSDASIPPGSQPPPNPGGGSSVVPPPPAPGSGAGEAAKIPLNLATVTYLSDKLEQAELLLGYAAEVGIEVKDAIRNDVLKARAESSGGKMNEETAADLLTALTTLATDVRPVTVTSLKFCVDESEIYEKETRKTIRYYLAVVILCAVPIVVCSLFTFVFNHFAEKIKEEVTSGNALVVKLQAELGPAPTNEPSTNTVETNKQTDDQIWWGAATPPRGLDDKDVLHDLQEFAVTMREIYEFAGLLNHILPRSQPDPYAGLRTNSEAMRAQLEFKPGFMYRLSHEFAKKLEAYQHVRAFGDSVQENGSVFYGAFATYILPILYALLGASAYLLRLYEGQIKNRSYVGGGRNPAHLVVAGISGMVVGLFNNVTQGVAIGPFAEAFLVGYAVDVFFSFLEGLLQMFRRTPDNPAHHN